MSTPIGTRIDAQQKRAQALELRRSGATFQQIADALGYANAGTVHRMVRQALAAIPVEAAEAYRAEELDRLDALQRGLWPAARSGNVRAAEACLRVMESRRKLLGLDAPTRIDAKVSSELDAEIEQLVELLSEPSA